MPVSSSFERGGGSARAESSAVRLIDFWRPLDIPSMTWYDWGMTNSNNERLYYTEAEALSSRRRLIETGAKVSLISYDGGRDCYVFDVIPPLRPRCNFEICDGNSDDPSYAYCGLPLAHAGNHGDWQM